MTNLEGISTRDITPAISTELNESEIKKEIKNTVTNVEDDATSLQEIDFFKDLDLDTILRS